MSTLDNNSSAAIVDSVRRNNPAKPESSDNDLSSLLNYPSIGRLFDGPDQRALENMRSRFSRTAQELERVIRQGSKEDAEKASRAIKAINITLDFLNTLDRMRSEQKPS